MLLHKLIALSYNDINNNFRYGLTFLKPLSYYSRIMKYIIQYEKY